MNPSVVIHIAITHSGTVLGGGGVSLFGGGVVPLGGGLGIWGYAYQGGNTLMKRMKRNTTESNKENNHYSTNGTIQPNCGYNFYYKAYSKP